ncbi:MULTISPECIES: DEAD/DEAH box helicase [Vibrio]|uniref:DEAD/DEAH box helicase n=5 Tax=Vibrio cyclitrophicus TaxID=47951 RepID=A0A7Z1S325_9VIBR|nr:MULTISPECIES: DEAD/DEAH box helicase [Vibrio]KNH12263.1 DEAD/DEAH box helicase [Vibrio lentus]ERM57582.1 ATP-dependent RNA helicase [Vibrio cyclitrophicus FF75]MBE8557567.1 DEAD/DEAH box helicase [Vibrio sp. OPT24]MBE8606659.1 DEAD/DEAH box helicase [Vibrio sp. OPT10]NOH19039.1 DEAD/DEAH box helicase [Vibrio cyclitrophicus]|tara:strand:- start:4406 stop:5677 length:1272 start_codon:yes stop_codon:yes gene_type:complete
MSESTKSFNQLGLSEHLLATLAELNFTAPTSVQEQAIPLVLEGKDVLAGAQTGTGKTAAFGLPIIQRLIETKDNIIPNPKLVRALVLVPTRELAQQVFDNVTEYAKGTDIKVVVAYGGVSMKVQTDNLRGGADILVATPGRLIDHMFTKNIMLSHTEVLVLDEADRMLDMGFMPDIKRILSRMNEVRQTLFFSATFDNKIKAIAHRMMQSPSEIQVTPKNSTAETVTQMVYPVDKSRKSELLAYLIGSKNWQQVLVFTKTKQGTDALVKELKLDGIKAASINGDKSQGARQKALDDFKSGKVRALIATDVAARGIDIQQLEQVVNYDLPFKAEDYVHRIGRTGRAGNSGLAISLMSQDEAYLLGDIERLLDTRLPQEWLEGFEPSLEKDVAPERGGRSKSRSSEKRKMKAKLKIHQNRGKARR